MDEIIATLQSPSTWIPALIAIPVGWFTFYSQGWIDQHRKSRRESRQAEQEAESREFQLDLKMLHDNPSLAPFFMTAESRLRWSSFGWLIGSILIVLSMFVDWIDPDIKKFGIVYIKLGLGSLALASSLLRAYKQLLRANEKAAIMQMAHDAFRFKFAEDREKIDGARD